MPPYATLCRIKLRTVMPLQVLTANDCEGAGEIFDAVLPPAPAPASGTATPLPSFFGIPMHLSVSAQLHAEAAACALGRVYSFGPTFRAENSNTPRHLAEFWMLEPEASRVSNFKHCFRVMPLLRAAIPLAPSHRMCRQAAHASMEDMMGTAEGLIASCAQGVAQACERELEWLVARQSQVLPDARDAAPSPSLPAVLSALAAGGYARVTYTDAIKALSQVCQHLHFTH